MFCPLKMFANEIDFFFAWRSNHPANICQQVQDIEFMQIEMQVIEGLKVGNECLKSMHEVNTLSCLFVFLVSKNKSVPFRQQ